MNTIQYSLRNATINFTVEMPTADKLREMSDEMLIALAAAGIDNVAYRAAAKDDNDGKSFTLEEFAKLAVGSTRKGEPSKADVARAKDWRAQVWQGLDKSLAVSDKTAKLHETFNDYCERVLVKFNGTFDDFGIVEALDEDNTGDGLDVRIAKVMRYIRLKTAEQARRDAAKAFEL